MCTLGLFLMALACQPDEAEPAAPRETGTTTGETALDGTGDTAGDTAHTGTSPPADTAYVWIDSAPSCLARVDLPHGPSTTLVCAPAGHDGEGRLEVYEDRDLVFPLSGVLHTAVWATFAVDPATAAPGVTHRFEVLVVDLERATSIVVASGISYGSHPDRIEVSELVPIGEDRAFGVFRWPETGRRTLVELEAGRASIDRTPTAADVEVLGGAGECVWARVDGDIGRMCPAGVWQPMGWVRALGAGSASSVVVEAQPSGDEVLALWDGGAMVSRSAPLPVPAVDPTWLPTGGGVFAHGALHMWTGGEGDAVSFDWPSQSYQRIQASPTGSHVAFDVGKYDDIDVVRLADMHTHHCLGSSFAWTMEGHYVVASTYPYTALEICDPTDGGTDALPTDVRWRPLSVQW